MTDSPTPSTPPSDALARHLRDALRNADHPDARYHIRHALQYAAVGADGAGLDPEAGTWTGTETEEVDASDAEAHPASTDDH